jgi:hypothetical protein
MNNMNNFSLFSKDEFGPMLAKYGFTKIDDTAFIKIVLSITVLVENIMKNVIEITKASNSTKITKKHFSGVIQAMEKIMSSSCKTHQKGGTSMPSEFFGIESGQYHLEVSNEHNSVFTDNMFTRNGMINTMMDGGAKQKKMGTFIDLKKIRVLIEKFLVEHNTGLSITPLAVSVVLESVLANIDDLMEACRHCSSPTTKTLTEKLMYKVLDKHCSKFAHMSYLKS